MTQEYFGLNEAMDMKYSVLCVLRICIVFVVLTLVFVMTMEHVL